MAVLPGIAVPRRHGGYAISHSYAVTGNNAIPSGASCRNKLASAQAGGSLVRVTFKAGNGGSVQINNASIGRSNGTASQTDATPVELKFGGVSGFTLSANAQITSDWALLTTLPGQMFIVTCDYGGGSNSNDAILIPGGANGREYFTPGATYNSANPGAPTGSDGQIELVSQVEVQ
jgi:hypothetical protein